jgi:hypothetical protein
MLMELEIVGFKALQAVLVLFVSCMEWELSGFVQAIVSLLL